MVPLKTLLPWMLLLSLGDQLSAARSRSQGGADRAALPPPGRGHRSGESKAAVTGRGKFTLKDKTQCAWGARGLDHQVVRLSVKCENAEARATGGTTETECRYEGKPQLCPGYASDPKGFWKQVARAFKRLQGKVCRDQRALVKAGMCKRAPQDAHFKLDIRSAVSSSQAGGDATPAPARSTSTTTTTSTSTRSGSISSNSTGRGCGKHRKTAEEYCKSQWASVCTFFFSMMQTEEC